MLDLLEVHERAVNGSESDVGHLVEATELIHHQLADLTLHEVNEAAEIVRAAADKDANIIFGTVIDEKMSGEIKITVVATGFVTGAETSREIDEQYSRPAPVEEVPAYRGFDPSNLDIPAFLRGRR